MENIETRVKNPEVKKDVVSPDFKNDLANNMPTEEILDKNLSIELNAAKTEEQKKGLMQKIKSIFAQSEDKLLKKAEERLSSNPMLKAGMEELEKTDPVKAEKWKLALGKWMYPQWDEKTQNYVDKGKYTEVQNSYM